MQSMQSLIGGELKAIDEFRYNPNYYLTTNLDTLGREYAFAIYNLYKRLIQKLREQNRRFSAFKADLINENLDFLDSKTIERIESVQLPDLERVWAALDIGMAPFYKELTNALLSFARREPLDRKTQQKIAALYNDYEGEFQELLKENFDNVTDMDPFKDLVNAIVMNKALEEKRNEERILEEESDSDPGDEEMDYE